MTVTIRPASPVDAEAISAIHINARRQAYSEIMAPEALALMVAQATPRFWARRLHPASRLGWGLVAVENSGGAGESDSGGAGESDSGGVLENSGGAVENSGGAVENSGGAVENKSGGVIVGFVFVGPSEEGLAGVGELEALHVDPERQGSGVGGRLLDAGLAVLAQHGFTSQVLWVLEGNERAIRFYLNRGWRPDGQRVRDVGGYFLRFIH